MKGKAVKRMAEGCLLCHSPLVYLNNSEEMTCGICGRKAFSRARCLQGHYVCDSCHTEGLDGILSLCLSSSSQDPAEILEAMMALPFCHMHGPEHHVMVGAALLTAYANAGGKIGLKSALKEMIRRGKSVPGGACGFWGACGAGISTGMFVSIVSASTPLAREPFALSHQMTARSLEAIGRVGGPRCCKRDAYLSLAEAVLFAREHLGVDMPLSRTVCRHYPRNHECLGSRCPFHPSSRKEESP